MLKMFGLVCAFTIATAAPAMAQLSNCDEPIAPAPINGAAATLKQVSDASHDANVFMKQSDDYQACIGREMKEAKAKAAKDKKPVDADLVAAGDSKIDASQKDKERVGTEFHTSFVAFCQKNPSADASCAKIVGAKQ